MRHVLALFLGLILTATTLPALAQTPEPKGSAENATYPHGMSEYEWRFVSRIAKEKGLRVITSEEAEGRPIRSIVVETLPVFAKEDELGLLEWANAFHVTSQEDVIKREVLLSEGQKYTEALAKESSRNLRDTGLVLSMARVLPTEDGAGNLHILVVSKDLWSLRLSYAYSFVDNTLLSLFLAFSETNLFGRHKYAAGTMLLEQDTLTLGEVIRNPRVFGSRIAASESFSVILNRDSGDYEGFNGLVSVGQPLFSLRTKWAWSLSAGANRSITRVFQGKDIFTSNFDGPERQENLPWIWRAETDTAQAKLTRSFGLKWKNNLSAGYQFYRTRFRFAESDSEADAFSPEAQEAMRTFVMPRSERASGVFVEHEFFRTKFHALRNFNTFALPEDTREGPFLSATMLHSEPGLGANTRFQTVGLSSVYRWVFDGDDPNLSSRKADVLSVDLGYGARRTDDGEWIDHAITAGWRNYSPVFWGGRLVTRMGGVYRYDDQSNSFLTMGGDSGLRGYPAALLAGKNRASGHIEFRTMPARWRALHFGAVLFYDAGVIGERENLSDLEFLQDVGLGVRAMNPLANRIVLRADYAFPLTSHIGTLPGTFTSGFEQAF